ncbi:MFS transporter [Paenalcaligenes niemegkensis]|uniref:MFS transporter n=1 Tax=Paenalcaligenes niemegkensis TaxID=2895469 RepID=UPI0027E27F71|nr:MFS transporter [Paenalcaligenes niemegkensis]
MTPTTNDSWATLLSGRNGLRSLALAGGVSVHAINVYLVTTILPSVVRDIGGLEYYAWNMTLFVMASILGSTLSPKFIQSFGLRNAFFIAMGIFIAGTACCAVAPSMTAMLMGRTVQGLGGGFLLGLSYSAVRIVFEEALWPRAMVLISSMWGVATLIGPTLGGIFAQSGHWRLAFWSVIPVVLLLLVLVWTQIKPTSSRDDENVKVPAGKIVVLGLSVFIVSYASLSDQWPINALGLATALVLTILVGRADNGSAANLLPHGTYRFGGSLAVYYLCVAFLSLAVTIEVFIPYFLQTIHEQRPLIAGYFMASISFGWTSGSFLSAGRSVQATERYVQFGPLVSAAGLLLLAILMPLDLTQYMGGAYWLILPLVCIGGGIGVCWPHLLTRVFHVAPAGQENIASAAIITVQLYALALGGR